MNNINNIPKNIGKRDDISIKNKYEIIKLNNDDTDFHIAIYYLNSDKCKIIIRRLDEESGWNINIKIKIYDVDNENTFEQLSLGSSSKNCKIIHLNSLIVELKPIEIYIQKIPKVIVQTSYNNLYKSLLHYNAVQTFLELNPEYKYEFYDDADCRKFIKNNFEECVLDSFDLLNPGAYKADLFRLCVIYINGGCYIDNKYILRVPLRNIIHKEALNVFCKDTAPNLMFNSIIFSVRKNEVLKKCIDDIVSHVRDNYYGKCPLFPTGPGLLNIHASGQNILLQHKVDGKRYVDSKVFLRENNKVVINTHYKGYYGNEHDKNSYTTLYHKKEVYYKNIVKKDNFTFIIYPNPNNDKFDFEINGNNSFIIKRIDKDSGWGLDLKIKIINNLDNSSKLINVGKSESNNIVVTI